MKSKDIKELHKWLNNLLKEKYINKADIKQILNDFDWDDESNLVEARVMPNEVLAGDIKLMFGEDTEKYSLWCEIVNDVFMEYDTTSEGEDAQILIDKIERLLKLVSQREA